MFMEYTPYFEQTEARARAQIADTLHRLGGMSHDVADDATECAIALTKAVEMTFAVNAHALPDYVQPQAMLVAVGLCVSLFERMQNGLGAVAEAAGDPLASTCFHVGLDS